MSLSSEPLPSGITGRALVAMKSGRWWTPIEVAMKTGDHHEVMRDALDLLLGTGAVDRRHIGNDQHGDLYAYRICGRSEWDAMWKKPFDHPERL